MRRIGTLTCAFSMLALGLLLLIDIAWNQKTFMAGLNFWPLIIIGLGLELFLNWLTIRRKRLQEVIRLDGRSLALLFLVGVFSINFYLSAERTASGEEEVPPAQTAPLLTVTDRDIALPTQIVHLPLDARELTVDNPLGNIEIVTSKMGKTMSISAVTHVSALGKSSPETLAHSLSPYVEVGAVTTLQVREDKELEGSQGTIDLKIEVPADLKLTISSVQGSVSITDYKGVADLKVRTGTVEVDKLGGNLTVELQDGSIAVQEVTGKTVLSARKGGVSALKIGGDLTLKSDGGDIEVADVEGNLDLHASYGKATIDRVTGNIFAQATSAVLDVRYPGGKFESTVTLGDVIVHGDVLAPWTLNTSEGKVTLEIPSDSNIKFLGETNQGVIKGPTKQSKNGGIKQGTLLTEKMGEGTYPVTVRSYSGSIFVDLYEKKENEK